MTSKQREQVVELLRRTADRLDKGASMVAPFTDTCTEIYGNRHGAPRILATVRHVMGEVAPTWWDDFDNVQTASAARSAAERVESKEWP